MPGAPSLGVVSPFRGSGRRGGGFALRALGRGQAGGVVLTHTCRSGRSCPTRRCGTLYSCASRVSTMAPFSTASSRTSWRRAATRPARGKVPTAMSALRLLERPLPCDPPSKSRLPGCGGEGGRLENHAHDHLGPCCVGGQGATASTTGSPSRTSSTRGCASRIAGWWRAPTRTSRTPTAASSSSRWTRATFSRAKTPSLGGCAALLSHPPAVSSLMRALVISALHQVLSAAPRPAAGGG